jgi:hypothetical protein
VSPFEKLFGRKPTVNKFRPFGCLAYIFQHESKRKKLDTKSILCILLSTLEHGNYRVYTLATKKVYVSRHVVFSETEFPACIVIKRSRVDCVESQGDSSDSDISLRTGTDDSEKTSNQPDSLEEEVEESSDSAADGDDEEAQKTKMKKKETKLIKMTKMSMMSKVVKAAHTKAPTTTMLCRTHVLLGLAGALL